MGGNDTILTGTAGDVIDGGSGDNQINADQTNFAVPTSGNDGIGGDDIVVCGSGADLIATWGGNDEVRSGDGVDEVFTGNGDDVIYAGGGSSTVLQEVQAGRGDDRLYGGDGRDNLRGGENDDLIFGAGGSDRLNGGSGHDRMFGEAGTDELFGRGGLDELSGGSGNDTYVYDAVEESGPGSSSRDVIVDYNGVGGAAGDRIALSAIDANAGVSGNQTFVFIGSSAITKAAQIRVNASGADTLVQANTGGAPAAELEILVKDGAASPSQWVAGDFIL